ncbi:hypothetical protein [Rossellomorea yichunensis]|uniref:hypothetical protein n=1 Tax=Rossellomorea yichunensis TaxID=3077331 RepID=UPI0028DD70C5|nr:hypothetical protein [Rossellomorea sp. YC4-1]MDT9026844.1 hypothetical protein [Rossellomorea sp. YC4-1]
MNFGSINHIPDKKNQNRINYRGIRINSGQKEINYLEMTISSHGFIIRIGLHVCLRPHFQLKQDNL